MNFIPVGRAADDASGAVVQLPGGALLSTGIALPRDAADGVVLGVRPEALQLHPDGPLPGTVEVIERLGDRTLLHVQLADGTLVVADGRGQREPAMGEAVRFDAVREKLHLFDASGRAHRAS